MAIEAEIFALGRGKTDAIAGFPGRPMTAQALTVNRGTVPPWAFLDHIAVALDAGCAADHAGYADGFATIESWDGVPDWTFYSYPVTAGEHTFRWRVSTTSGGGAGDLAFVDVTGRVAHAIMDLCNEPDAMTHPDGMQIKTTRQDIAKMVGCSREMAGRVLRELEEEGLISAHGKTVVVFGAR